MDFCVVLGLGLLGGEWAVVRAGTTLLGVWALMLILRGRLRAALLGALLVAVAVGSFRAQRALARFETERWALRAGLHGSARCEGEGIVSSSPTILSARPAL